MGKKRRKKFTEEHSEEEDHLVFLDDLAPEDWSAIKRIAVALIQEGKYRDEPLSTIQFKCAIAAFNEWLSRTEMLFCVGDKPKKSIH